MIDDLSVSLLISRLKEFQWPTPNLTGQISNLIVSLANRIQRYLFFILLLQISLKQDTKKDTLIGYGYSSKEIRLLYCSSFTTTSLLREKERRIE